jgi:hypothetical protein
VASYNAAISASPSACVSLSGERRAACRIGQRALQRVVLARQRRAKRLERRVERLDPAGIDRAKRIGAANHLQRCPLLRPGFGEQERPVLELERGQDDLGAHTGLFAGSAPAQASRDHQVNDQDERPGIGERPWPERSRGPEGQGDSLADARDALHRRAEEMVERWVDGAEHERAHQPDSVEPPPGDVRGQCFYVHCDVGQFRHSPSVAQETDVGRARPRSV